MSIITTFLIHDELLNPELAAQAIQNAQKQNLSVVNYLVSTHIINSKDIIASLIKHLNLSFYDVKKNDMHSENYLILNEDIIKRHRVLPIKITNNILELGMTDPTDKYAIDIVGFHTGFVTYPVIICEHQLTEFIKKTLDKHNSNNLLTISHELMFDDDLKINTENTTHNDEPLIQFVDNILKYSIQESASDIHLEPFENYCRIRFRQDGILYEITKFPIKLFSRIATRLKVMAQLNISERRLPQDGRFQFQHIDMRINTCPTLFGEKIVIRLLDPEKSLLNICDLGLTPTQQTIFYEKISEPQGLILVTGPTGSGKTATLYSALQHINSLKKNILTIEDPVEIQLNGINQVNVNPKIGLEFSNILRSFLRQDPDIMMIGEIRDKETADIAIQAAQTGHLVFSTLHTNSAIEALTRLHSIGLASYNIVSSLSLIIAQRLVRKLCAFCKKPDPYAEKNIYLASQCRECLQGYKGREAIYELFPITKKLSKIILKNSDSNTLLTYAKKDGFKTLHEIGFEKASLGITSLAELNRVI